MMDMMKAFFANGGQNLIDRVTEGRSGTGSQELLHTKLNYPEGKAKLTYWHTADVDD
jgi:hypothetical protein